mmetsp:Transcript_27003/g.62844  ORF Transcript_27003/g.62844 Transcript_27003/m.62844 type:complete len:418 (-) Transcript_27003:42-1295(-)
MLKLGLLGLLATCFHPARGVREAISDNSSALGADGLSLPRNCDYMTSFSSKCCACGKVPKIGNRALDAFTREMYRSYGYVDNICSREKDPKEPKICCPIWAVDCQEDDPRFQQGLERDCAPTAIDCKYNECKDVIELANTLSDQLNLKDFDSDLATYEERMNKDLEAGMTGKSGWCDCGCGDLMNDQKLKCKALNGSFVCPEVRGCCRNLQECNKDDPWPKEVRQQKKQVKSQRRVSAKEENFYRHMVKALNKLIKKCGNSCDILRKSMCLNELRGVEKKVLLGKDVTFQQKKEERRFQKLLEYNEAHPPQAAWLSTTGREFRQFEFEESRANYDKERELNRWRRDNQLVQMPRINPDKMTHTIGNCCACERRFPGHDPVGGKYPMVQSFCESKKCGLDCFQVPDVFCGGRDTSSCA